jgi:hypothetical protein
MGFGQRSAAGAQTPGVEFEVAESALAHVAGGVVKAYQRSPLLERRRPVMADWAAFLSGDSESAEVVPLRRVAP